MRILVSWGSKLGGTEGVARLIGKVLRDEGHEVALLPAARVRSLNGYDAAIIGGGLYANRWHRHAYRLVSRNVRALRQIPTWLFSSGPLDDSADRSVIPPVRQVAVLMERIGAQGHATFGGRLSADVRQFPAAAMAKTRAGDWRNTARIQAWANGLAHNLPGALPRPAGDPPGRSLWRLLSHATTGWAACAGALLTLVRMVPRGWALALHGLVAPLVFAAVATHYFKLRGARDPLPAALTFAACLSILEIGVVWMADLAGFTPLAHFVEMGMPVLLSFIAVWMTGVVLSMMPWPVAAKTVLETPRRTGRR